ncbi:MAG: DUF2911 domain-containing protein [Gemmatimonadota bacterium]
MRASTLFLLAASLVLLPAVVVGQDRPASPRGTASTQVGGSFDAEGSYQGGYWIDVDYGRPILRGRENMFGSGDTYGDGFLLGAPIWRVGANRSTRFSTETDLMFGDQRLPAGEYSIFADLAENEWTLVFSTWGVKQSFQEENPDALWGAYGYTPDRDVLRVPMTVSTHPISADQLIITFTDMTQDGGDFTVWWDDQVATTPFTVAD